MNFKFKKPNVKKFHFVIGYIFDNCNRDNYAYDHFIDLEFCCNKVKIFHGFDGDGFRRQLSFKEFKKDYNETLKEFESDFNALYGRLPVYE